MVELQRGKWLEGSTVKASTLLTEHEIRLHTRRSMCACVCEKEKEIEVDKN